MGEMAGYYADMWLDGADWDEETGWINPYGVRVNLDIKCKYCGRTGFCWKQIDDGWRLYTSNGRIHSCKKYNRLGDKVSKNITVIGSIKGAYLEALEDVDDGDTITIKQTLASRSGVRGQCIKLIEDVFKNDKIAKKAWVRYVNEANLYATHKQFMYLLQALYTLT